MKAESQKNNTSTPISTVVSWPLTNKEYTLYNNKMGNPYLQFPPGLYDAKAIEISRFSVAVMMADGALKSWSAKGYLGGQSSFHRHISSLKNVSKVKWRKWSPFMGEGLYVWQANGSCELHEQNTDDSNGKIKVTLVENSCIDVIIGSEKGDYCVLQQGLLKPLIGNAYSLDGKPLPQDERKHVLNLARKINADPKLHLKDYKKGYLFADDGGALLIWLNQKGELHLETEGNPNLGEEAEAALPKEMELVDDFVPCGNASYIVDYIVLRKGKITALNLIEANEFEIKETTAIKSIKSPIKRIKDVGNLPDTVIALSENGKSLLVTVKALSEMKVNRREKFKKSSISPACYYVIDAIATENEIISIVDASSSVSSVGNVNPGFINQETYKLYVWGKGRNSPYETVSSCVDIAKKPDSIVKVVDVAVYYTGWICVLEDGSLFGLDSESTVADQMQICPPWFPSDFVSVNIERGIKLTRRNGEVWYWGNSDYIAAAKKINLGELAASKGHSATEHLVPPEELQECIKIFRADDLVVALAK